MLLSQIDFDLNINDINLESINEIEEDESDKDSKQNIGININNKNFELIDENIIKKQKNININFTNDIEKNKKNRRTN